MARSRMIRPEFWDDEKLARVSRGARLTFIALWNHSDDYGVVKGNHTWLKNNIYPYDESLSLKEFAGWIGELEDSTFIVPFEVAGESYYYIRTFGKHQTINRPSAQRNPEPPEHVLRPQQHIHGVFTSETETEVKPKQKPKKRAVLVSDNPPSEKEVMDYILERCEKEYKTLVNPIGAETQAKLYYSIRTGNNWIKQGGHGDPVKNWKLDAGQWVLSKQKDICSNYNRAPEPTGTQWRNAE